MEKIIHSERHQKALEYALKQISESSLLPFVDECYLYGSCARHEEKFPSDVDLFLVLAIETYNNPIIKNEIIRLKGAVSSNDIRDPEVQLYVAFGHSWENSNKRFYNNIKKDGIKLWNTVI